MHNSVRESAWKAAILRNYLIHRLSCLERGRVHIDKYLLSRIVELTHPPDDRTGLETCVSLTPILDVLHACDYNFQRHVAQLRLRHTTDTVARDNPGKKQKVSHKRHRKRERPSQQKRLALGVQRYHRH